MTKRKREIRAWRADDLPQQPGFIADSRSGKKIFYGKGRKRDIPLRVLDKHVDENKHKVIGSQTTHTDSEHIIQKTVIEKKSKKVTLGVADVMQNGCINRPAPFQVGDRVLFKTTRKPGIVVKMTLVEREGKLFWAPPSVRFDSGARRTVSEKEIVKIPLNEIQPKVAKEKK